MNDRGFISVAMLALMPLLTAVFAVAIASYQILVTDGEIRHQCRTQLLKSQEKTAALLEKLMKINPEATELRKWEKRFNQTKAVLPGATKVIPYAGLAAVKTRQLFVSAQQKSLIALARIESQVGPMRASRLIRTGVPPEAELLSKRKAAKFDVIAHPPQSLTPDYYPSPQFSQAQIMQVTWEISIKNLLPKWLGSFLDLEKIKLRGVCSATIEKKGKTWHSVLSAAKL